MDYEVRLSESAIADLNETKFFIASVSGVQMAESWDKRVRSACRALGTFPRRGTPRDELAVGLRSTNVKGRSVIFYRVSANVVEIVRVLYAGREVASAFAGN